MLCGTAVVSHSSASWAQDVKRTHYKPTRRLPLPGAVLHCCGVNIQAASWARLCEKDTIRTSRAPATALLLSDTTVVQVAAAAAAARSMLSKAAAISTAVEAEERLHQVQAGLRDCEEQANDAVKVLIRRPQKSCTLSLLHWCSRGVYAESLV